MAASLAIVLVAALQCASALQVQKKADKTKWPGDPKIFYVTSGDQKIGKMGNLVNHMFACASNSMRTRLFEETILLESSNGYWGKLPALQKYLNAGLASQTMKSNDIIFFSDAFDVVYSRKAPAEEVQAFLEKQGGSKNTVVFNGESDCWPKSKLCGTMMEQQNKMGRRGDLAYLNSGQIIGSVQALQAFLKGYLDAIKVYGHIAAGDQHIAQHACYDNATASLAAGFQCSVDQEGKMMLTSQGAIGRQGDYKRCNEYAKNMGSAISVHFNGKEAKAMANDHWKQCLTGFADALNLKPQTTKSCLHFQDKKECIPDPCNGFSKDVHNALEKFFA